MANNHVTLGQEAFVVVTTNGEVERTKVGAIERSGYTFLNGSHSSRTHWFDFDQAVAASVGYVKDREASLRAQLKTLAKRREFLQSEAYRAEVLGAPYKVADLRLTDRRKPTRRVKMIAIPTVYLKPGDRAFTIISPQTRARFSEADVYRPHPHFVLEIEVASVCFTADGVVHYTFTTPLTVDEIYKTRAKAKTALQGRSEPGVSESVHFVSRKEERQKLAEIPDPHPF